MKTVGKLALTIWALGLPASVIGLILGTQAVLDVWGYLSAGLGAGTLAGVLIYLAWLA